MGLASAMSTALTGLTAAETTIDVVGNNLANSNTVGFKASEAAFATQFLQTQSLGSGPTTNSGGTNPRQTGLGTLVAEITPNFNQGTIEISSNPTDLAIQGDGFYIVQGNSGEQLFTRNGILKLNSQNELVTITGNRLLGFDIDDQFQIQTTTLQPLKIPLGAAAVAQPTANAFLEGTLSPTGDLADTAEILQSGILGDASFTAPAAGTTVASSVAPNVAATTATPAIAAGSIPLGTYLYRVVFADDDVLSVTNTEGLSSADISATLVNVPPNQNTVNLANIPVDPAGTPNTTRRIYRSSNAGANFYFVGEIPDNVTTTFSDVSDLSIEVPANELNTDTIDGSYIYRVTFADTPGGPGSGFESRPTGPIGPIIVNNGRIQLRDLPVAAGGSSWSVRRIYRSLSTDDSVFHYVGEIADATTPNLTYTDNALDATIALNPQVDLDGPKITSATLLTDVLSRDGNSYNSIFQEGTLEFTGRKGGRSLQAKTLTISAATTVLELASFMEQAMGIRGVPGPDPLNVIPGDISGSNPGGSVTATGQIRLVANNGVENALSIGLSGLQLTSATGTDNVNLSFSSSQTAVGEGAVADFIAYDSLGIPLAVRMTMVLESRDSTSTTYRWFADSPDNDPTTGVDIAVGTGLITFDGEGNFTTATESTVSIQRRNVSSASPLEFEIDFSQISGLQTDNSTLAVSRQDGSGPGVLTSFIIGEDGLIRGVFSNGMTRDLGQIRLARFSNPSGLEQKGQNLYATGVNSGLPVAGNPGQQGIGTIIAGAQELSNTDIGSNLIDLILASTMYRGNTRVITTAQQMLDELLSLRR